MIYNHKFLFENAETSVEVESPIVESMTIGQYIDFNNQIICALTEASLFDDEYEDIVTEGANLDYTKAIMKFKKEFKASIKSFKAAKKEDDKSKMKSSLAEMKSSLGELKKEMSNIDETTTVGTAIFGYFAGALLSTLRMFLPMTVFGAGLTMSAIGGQQAMNSLITGTISGSTKALTVGGSFLAGAGYAAAVIKSIIQLIQSIVQFVNDLKSGAKAENTFNYYRNQIMGFIKTYETNIDKLSKEIK